MPQVQLDERPVRPALAFINKEPVPDCDADQQEHTIIET